MTVDVVCAGAPFLDLVFRGLPRMPAAGEEVLASELVIVPGAMANVAFALRQLELDAVVCAPIGSDPAGRLLQALMAESGVPWLGEPTTATPISVGLPIGGERSFITVDPRADVDVAAIVAARPRAVVMNLPMPTGMPPGPRLFAVIGDPQVAILRERPVEDWTDLRALVLNEREASGLTGRSDATEAARVLARRGCLVIVTCGERGVVASRPDGQVVEAPGVPVHALDTVGAGDLFTAAFIWADLSDHPLEECLTTATSYASYSLGAPAPRQKGLSRAAYLAAVATSTEPPGLASGGSTIRS